MSQITAASVNELRKRTDMPLMDCKSALTEAAGDMDKAIEILRSRNKNVAVKRGLNETAEGRIAVAILPETATAAIIEMRCESAPVVKSDQFLALANDLARGVAENNPASVAEFLGQKLAASGLGVTDRINEVIGLIRENMKPQRFQRLQGGVFGQYIHHDGTIGVLIQAAGAAAADEVLRDVGAHIAAMNPPYAKLEDVPADLLAKEKEIALKQMQDDPKNAGKPANILEKIVEGKLKTWGGENVLLEQPIANQAKYEKKTVGQVLAGAGLQLTSFIRFKVGEIVA
ncbi:MAG: translation elongation factor Ts [Bacteroidales bacterium]|nr:translation elongation factor Ts [Bacteroidales bacterium]